MAHIGSMRLSSVHHAPPTRYQPQCGHGADCPARWLATIRSRRRRASQLLLRLQRCPHGSLKKVAISRLQGARAKQPLSTIEVASILHVAATAATLHLPCRRPALTPSTSVACRRAVATSESASSCQRHWPGPSAGRGHEISGSGATPGDLSRAGPNSCILPPLFARKDPLSSEYL